MAGKRYGIRIYNDKITVKRDFFEIAGVKHFIDGMFAIRATTRFLKNFCVGWG